MTPSDAEFARVVSLQLEAISKQMMDVVKRLDHMDECLDRTKDHIRDQLLAHIRTVETLLTSARATMDAKLEAVDARNELPRWVTRLVVAVILLGALGLVWSTITPTPESKRTFSLPTTPYRPPPPPKEDP